MAWVDVFPLPSVFGSFRGVNSATGIVATLDPYGLKGPMMLFCRCYQGHTLPETNSEFAPENGWLEYDCFLLRLPIFRCFCC